MGRNVTFSCKIIHFDFFRNFGDVFDRFFQNRVIRLQRNNLKKPYFSEIFFPLNFSRFSRKSLDIWRNVLRHVAAKFPLILTKLPSRCQEEKLWVFQAVLQLWTSMRPNVDEFGKQWVRRPIFCVDDFLCFIQNGGNEGDRCQATPTSEKMHLRKRNAICFWKNYFCVSFQFFFKNYKAFFNFLKENHLMLQKKSIFRSTISYAFCSNFATFNVFPTEKIFQIKSNISMIFEKSYYVNGNQPQTLGHVLVRFHSWFKIVNLIFCRKPCNWPVFVKNASGRGRFPFFS